MDFEVESRLLRVYCLRGDEEDGRPLPEAIVEAARRAGIAGATVVSGRLGFGRRGLISSTLLSAVEIDRQPVVVEIVDEPDHIAVFVPVLHALVRGRRLITLERVEIIRYAAGKGPGHS